MSGMHSDNYEFARSSAPQSVKDYSAFTDKQWNTKPDTSGGVYQSQNSIVEFDKTQCYIAASLKNQTKHKGLSLGDRACLATAIQLGLPVYTADKIWAELDLPNVKIKLIR